jgi:hypothetical protein
MNKAELGATLSGNQTINPPFYLTLSQTVLLPLPFEEAEYVVAHFRYELEHIDWMVGEIASLLCQFRDEHKKVLEDASGQKLLFDSGPTQTRDASKRMRAKKSRFRPDQMEFWDEDMPDDPSVN